MHASIYTKVLLSFVLTSKPGGIVGMGSNNLCHFNFSYGEFGCEKNIIFIILAKFKGSCSLLYGFCSE